MKANQLIKVLISLNIKEHRLLDKYVRSPFFNQRTDLVLLLNELQKAIRGSKDENIDERDIFQKVFKVPYDNIQFNHAKSQLLQLVYGFLAYQEQQEEAFGKEVMLTRALRKRQLDSVFESYQNRLKPRLEKHEYRNGEYYRQLHLIQLEKGTFARQQKRNADIGLQNIADSLSIHFIATILRHGCALLSQKAMKANALNFPVLSQILDLLENGHYGDEPVIQVYYYSYLALNEEGNTGQNFAQMRNILQEKGHLFPKEESRDLYLLAINYCIKKLNQGESEFIREAFDLYRSALGADLLLENGYLSPFTYNNILLLGLNLKEFKWVEEFLHHYKDYLPQTERENTFQYNLAIFYFRKPDYDEAMNLLQKVRFKDVLYNLDARRMLLRIYYEKQEWNALDSHLDSFRAYLYRQRNIGYHKVNYLNLVKIMKKMLSQNLRDRSVKAALRKETESTRALSEKEWLLEQLT